MSDHATVLLQFSRPRTPLRAWHNAVRYLAMMMQARRTRRILATMDPRLLKDIGVSRADAQTEVARAAWDIGPRS